MKLDWTDRRENSTARLGALEITCFAGRTYKDGSRQYSIWVSAPNGSREIITLSKIRGSLSVAKQEAEKLLGGAQ